MKTNSIKTVLSAVISSLLFVMTSCQKSPCDNAIDLIHELSAEVTSATDTKTYDEVYNKIVNLKTNPLITGLKDLSASQKQEFTEEMTNLTLEALAVKAILFEIPSSVTPTSEDIKNLCKKCIDAKASVITAGGYPEVKAIVEEYFKGKEENDNANH